MINTDYMNTAEAIYQDGKRSLLEINELTYFDGEQYDIYNDKDYARFIKDTETICRTSYEYRTLINFLRTTEGMNKCSFLTNTTNVDSTKVKIHIHHAPFTLWDICSTVIRKRLHNQESIDPFDVCKEVMWLHYMGYVGLVPLSETVHTMVHNSYIFVPLNIIRGNYNKFKEIYYNEIDPETLDMLDNAEEMTKAYLEDISNVNNQVNKQMDLFNLHETYVRIQNRNIKESIPKSKDDLKDRISTIKQEKKTMYKVMDKTKDIDQEILSLIK